jgi:hypothetical protein
MTVYRRARKVLVTTAAAAVIGGAAIGSIALLDSEPGESQPKAPASYTGDWKDLVVDEAPEREAEPTYTGDWKDLLLEEKAGH